jgi:hypothetical protein
MNISAEEWPSNSLNMTMYFSSLRKYREEAINIAILWHLKIDIWNIIMDITKTSRYSHEIPYNTENCVE